MTTALKFRNLTASPDDPVETWPFQWPSKFSRRYALPGHTAPPNYWKEWLGVPASLPQIPNVAKWPPRCEGLLVTPACPGKTSLTG